MILSYLLMTSVPTKWNTAVTTLYLSSDPAVNSYCCSIADPLLSHFPSAYLLQD